MFWNFLLVSFVFYNRRFQPLTAKQPYCQLMQLCGQFFSFIHWFIIHSLSFLLACWSGCFSLLKKKLLICFVVFSSNDSFVQAASAGLWATSSWTTPFSLTSPWACIVLSGVVSPNQQTKHKLHKSLSDLFCFCFCALHRFSCPHVSAWVRVFHVWDHCSLCEALRHRRAGEDDQASVALRPLPRLPPHGCLSRGPLY